MRYSRPFYGYDSEGQPQPFLFLSAMSVVISDAWYGVTIVFLAAQANLEGWQCRCNHACRSRTISVRGRIWVFVLMAEALARTGIMQSRLSICADDMRVPLVRHHTTGANPCPRADNAGLGKRRRRMLQNVLDQPECRNGGG